jgi:hypothetical protein
VARAGRFRTVRTVLTPMAAAQRTPLGAVFDIAELVALLNGASRPLDDGRPAWDRWKVLRLLRRRGVPLIQGAHRGKCYVTLQAFRQAWPDLWQAMVGGEDAEHEAA